MPLYEITIALTGYVEADDEFHAQQLALGDLAEVIPPEMDHLRIDSFVTRDVKEVESEEE